MIFWDKNSKKYVYVIVTGNHNETIVEIRSDRLLRTVSKDWNYQLSFFPPYSGGKKYLEKPLKGSKWGASKTFDCLLHNC